MIVKKGNEYINTKHIVSANADDYGIRLVNGSALYLDKGVFEKLLEIWLDDEMSWGVLYKEVIVEHSTAIEVREVTNNVND